MEPASSITVQISDKTTATLCRRLTMHLASGGPKLLLPSADASLCILLVVALNYCYPLPTPHYASC